jgi:uncharacterized membrane protein
MGKKTIIAAGLTSIALLALAFQKNPYEFYTILRIVVCANFVITLLYFQKEENEVMPWFSGLFAVLYNPVFQVKLNRSLWEKINAVTILYIIVVIAVIIIEIRKEDKK